MFYSYLILARGSVWNKYLSLNLARTGTEQERESLNNAPLCGRILSRASHVFRNSFTTLYNLVRNGSIHKSIRKNAGMGPKLDLDRYGSAAEVTSTDCGKGWLSSFVRLQWLWLQCKHRWTQVMKILSRCTVWFDKENGSLDDVARTSLF